MGQSLVAESRPNIVFVLADDVGPGDIAAFHSKRTGMPSPTSTPHLDKLAAEGMSFSDAHSPSALCAPTRYSSMTGNYPFRSRRMWGIWGSTQPSAILDGQSTIGELLKEEDYETAFFGKWGFGMQWYRKGSDEVYIGNNSLSPDIDFERGIADDGPVQFGFDYSLALPSGIQHNPFAVFENGAFYPLSKNSRIELIDRESHARQVPGSVLNKESGMADTAWDSRRVGWLLARKAGEFMRSSVKEDPNKPFFLYYCTQAVHIPHSPPESFDGEKIAGTSPSAHTDMVRELDSQIGYLRGQLEELGILENTLFVFTSDNGGLAESESLAGGHDSTNGLRAQKASIYEGGHRVPFIVQGSLGGDLRVSRGSESSQLVAVHDIARTLLEVAGGQSEQGELLDSVSILPTLLGTQNELQPLRTELLLQGRNPGPSTAFREGDWKLVMKEPFRGRIIVEDREPFGLYNLATNPLEEGSRNLIEDPDQQERVNRMLSRYIALRETARSARIEPAE